MRIVRDGKRCTGCGLCLQACPQLTEKEDLRIFNCNCEGTDCLHACPRGAIVEAGGLITIDRARCNGCGDCVSACPASAIIAQRGAPAKCDLCLGRPRCIEACPYGCLRLEPTDGERGAVRRLVGWEKISYGPAERVLEAGRNYDVAEIGGKAFFLTHAPEVDCEEARLLAAVTAAFRENCQEWEPAAVEELIDEYCEASGLEASAGQKRAILGRIEREVRGLSILDEFICNGCLEEVAVIGPKSPVFVYHRKFCWLPSDVRIAGGKKILHLINRVGRRLGRRATLQSPRLNASIANGRVHAAVAPIATSGNCMTVRLFGKKPIGSREMIENRTLTAEALAFLRLAVRSDANVLVCGNTGSGKTSLLNVLAGFFPERERIVIVEETPELVIGHDHQVRLCVQEGLGISMHELVADTLRMRPDRVIVGEVRTAEEARALMDTMLAGQGKSSLATFHSQNSEEALVRLRSLGLSAVDLCSLDLIVVQRRWTLHAGASRDIRRVTEISAVRKDYAAGAGIEPLYAYDAAKDALVRKNVYGPALFTKICTSFGLGMEDFEAMLASDAGRLAHD